MCFNTDNHLSSSGKQERQKGHAVQVRSSGFSAETQQAEATEHTWVWGAPVSPGLSHWPPSPSPPSVQDQRLAQADTLLGLGGWPVQAPADLGHVFQDNESPLPLTSCLQAGEGGGDLWLLTFPTWASFCENLAICFWFSAMLVPRSRDLGNLHPVPSSSMGVKE